VALFLGPVDEAEEMRVVEARHCGNIVAGFPSCRKRFRRCEFECKLEPACNALEICRPEGEWLGAPIIHARRTAVYLAWHAWHHSTQALANLLEPGVFTQHCLQSMGTLSGGNEGLASSATLRSHWGKL
jgi:hypothetical protein